MLFRHVPLIITARKRSLGQGNIFTPVCHSVHRIGGVHGCWRVCMVAGGHAWLPGGGGVHGGGACVVAKGGMHGFGGHAWLPEGHAWLPGGHAWLPGVCIGYNQIESMSRRYASYWNAFLFHVFFRNFGKSLVGDPPLPRRVGTSSLLCINPSCLTLLLHLGSRLLGKFQEFLFPHLIEFNNITNIIVGTLIGNINDFLILW